MNLRTASALAALAATLAVAGCGGSGNEAATAAPNPTTAPAYDYGKTPSRPTPEAVAVDGETTVKAVAGDLGEMLVDAEGRTLYLWEADRDERSACEGRCADAWPPLTATTMPAAGDGAHGSQLGTTKRADGTVGVTYGGHPLYYFAGDAGAGDTNGQGSDGFGAKWWVVSPDGTAIEG